MTDQIADIKANCDLAIEGRDVKIIELEEKISVLLSCKSCPENKGGWICAKEYENKCLAQKIQYIKELEEENAELKEKYDKVDIIGYDALKNLTKAENIIRELLFHLTNDTFYVTFETRGQSVERARQFLWGIKK